MENGPEPRRPHRRAHHQAGAIRQRKSFQTTHPPVHSFNGKTVLSFESRLAGETAALIEKYGGRAVEAPSMQEVPLEEHAAVFAFADALLAGEIDVLICLTGVGTRMMIEAMSTRFIREDVISALRRVHIVSRGPKPVAALREFDLKADVKVPEPNTWREILDAMDRAKVLQPLKGKRVAVQEYGIANEELLDGLREREAGVDQVSIYRWELPDDIEPLTNGIQRLVQGDVDIVVFTSRTQIDHVMTFARDAGPEAAVADAFDDVFVASIGPVCTEGLRGHGVEPDFEPSRPKLGVLMRELAERFGAADADRASSSTTAGR